VYLFFSNPIATHLFFTSTQRSPLSASIATQPSRAAVPFSHAHTDVSGFHFQANVRAEDAKDKREAKPEGYEALMFDF
jgi:hypothetical protein